jgi:hypothetical protein
MLSPSARERKDLGNPPRTQSFSQDSAPASRRSNPESSTNSTAREGLGDIFDNSGRCAAQYKKTGSVLGTINQNAQHIEQFRHDLDLVKDNDSIQGAEHKFRILEALKIGLRLEVEIGGFFPFRKYARESRLATLTGAKERGDWRAPCSSCQFLDIRGSLYHA